MSWEKVKLEDLCISITDGDHQSLPLAENGIPFIVIADINSNNRIDFSNARYVPLDYYEKLDKKRKPQKGDVLLTVKGSFGIPVYVADDSPFVFQRDIAILKCNKRINPRFLYYYMKNREFYLYTDSIAIGAAQRAITLKALKNTIIRLPPLDTQAGIVNLLSAYDDLIENNQKQIKLLEEAAQRLYKEWFVDLRFPGHENTPIVDGVPEGWVTGQFSDYTDIMSGGTPKTDVAEFYRGNIPFYTPKDSDGSFFAFDTLTHISESGLEHCNSKFYPTGTVIITARGTVGKTTILAVPMAMNQSCYALKSDTLNSPYYLFFSLNLEVEKLKTMANGGVFNTIIVKTFDQISLTIPQKEVLQAFDQRVTPIMEQIKAKMGQISLLKEARVRLLPKLMNGEIEV